MKHLFCIEKQFRGTEIVDTNGNTYYELQDAIEGNLVAGDIVEFLLLVAIQEEDAYYTKGKDEPELALVHYYHLYLKKESVKC